MEAAAAISHGGAPLMLIVVHERQVVADVLALGGDVDARALVDRDLCAVAIAAIALRPWRSLISSSLEDLVRALGGDAGDVEQLRREGALRRAA